MALKHTKDFSGVVFPRGERRSGQAAAFSTRESLNCAVQAARTEPQQEETEA